MAVCKTGGRNRLAMWVMLGLVACGAEPRDTEEVTVLTAATLGPQTVLTAGEYLAQAPYAEADEEYGDRISMQCRACHTFERGGPNMIGPNLYGVFGRPAGTAPGFPYSRALADVDFVWTPRALDAWLAEPARFLPGNSMAYPGLASPGDRAALIASLLRQTSRGGSEND